MTRKSEINPSEVSSLTNKRPKVKKIEPNKAVARRKKSSQIQKITSAGQVKYKCTGGNIENIEDASVEPAATTEYGTRVGGAEKTFGFE
ncbi:hypothetical protein ACH5RR_040486 [Cinchona calisaya]|uniref:Uncharacterized protein n=1 Tax=Cinchona calisaya TaxID=153742 RepID=A0ABD2XU71_9GENT